ncbi:MAG TPA: DNA primase small subunit domain-containing protein, partial [Micromonosporaceae bacterium]|nr:DNA primase small subunit domain-containing protein [Micromonosporaceae bacterium]
ADYYAAVARAMLPHLRGRPLALERFPDGVEGDGFMQKQLPAHAPGFVHHVAVGRVGGGEVDMLVCDNAATLRYLANQAAITLHHWLSRASAPRRPDRMVIDLDPAGDDFGPVRAAAAAVRGLLEEIDMPGYVMTTGSRGLHVTVPLAGRDDVDDVRAFAQDLAAVLVARDPDALTTSARKADRGGRLYVDVMRNSYAQHSVAPYSVRPLPGAPVATPLDWDELDDPKLDARRFTLRDIADRLGTTGDPWDSFRRRGPALSAARRRLDRLG